MATQNSSCSSSSSWASRSLLNIKKYSVGYRRISMANHEIPIAPSLLLHSKRADPISMSMKALILTRAIANSSGDEFAARPDDDVHDDFADSTSFFWAFSQSFNGVLQLGALFAVWYLFNIYFNIFNKQVLQLYPFPLTVSTVQFGVGTLFIILMWSMNLYKRPKISSSSQLLRIIPLAIAHTLGSIFTNVSLGMVAVSFTHTIKAMEPFFTVGLSSIFLGQFPTLGVLSSLLPVVGGVVLASITELSFNWPGFWTAMASNLANQSRNVLSKKLMVKKEESLDNINLFSIITIMSFIMSIPIALYGEGIVFTPYHIQSYGLNLKDIYTTSFLAALCFHGHQQVSYLILARVSPVSHSVGNCVKRVVVIVSSVLFFRTPVSFVNALGTAMALAGVFLYSRVNSMKAKST